MDGAGQAGIAPREFQDRCLKPLGHPSGAAVPALIPQSGAAGDPACDTRGMDGARADRYTPRVMSFIASKLFWWAANPGNVLLALLCLGLLALWLGRRRLGLWLVSLVTALCLLVTLLPIGSWLLLPLENRFPAPHLPAHIDGIVVLGGSINPILSAARHQPILTDSAERLFAFVALAQRFPEAKLLFTGGSAALVDDAEREADVARAVVGGLGLDVDRLGLERDSRNTYENAVFSKQLVKPKPGENWVLITSAYHMPRAVGCFREQGWSVIPYPVDYGTAPAGNPPTFSLLGGLDDVHWALREWIGLGFYYLAGRTDRLFPGPEKADS
jgi:uncharacterized SAM-binding protein YcdF (DUF218 family)